MEGNGQHDVASFNWAQNRILQGLQREGLPDNDVNTLRERMLQVGIQLEAYHREAKALQASGRFTLSGLQEELSARASEVAGKIKHIMNSAILRQHIRDVSAKVSQKGRSDPTEQLLGFWREMEYRTAFQQMGLVLVDSQTGALTPDPVKAQAVYLDALRHEDHAAQQALENWPLLKSRLVPPELAEQGRQQRQAAVDPVNAEKLSQLQRLLTEFERIERDALGELPISIDDPIVRIAAGGADVRVDETEAGLCQISLPPAEKRQLQLKVPRLMIDPARYLPEDRGVSDQTLSRSCRGLSTSGNPRYAA